MTPPMDPSECPGTPEYEELADDRRAYREMVKEVMAEQFAEETMTSQYPYRFGS